MPVLEAMSFLTFVFGLEFLLNSATSKLSISPDALERRVWVDWSDWSVWSILRPVFFSESASADVSAVWGGRWKVSWSSKLKSVWSENCSNGAIPNCEGLE
ncbi:hypothetical protein OGAPHI_001734 [Ogataea philodendri]|uniref:Secreted protein n=1 Tax=Ogataea philodendri TaxID=1378263 RepID=A0A9P8PA33_9ASCO|nr:uncharacterized protein OGAPHI_001734 [Ogataea philodendri]KAH3667980.1 hypothetical protein OGAPHI_001734 [Ogataea philodendri]